MLLAFLAVATYAASDELLRNGGFDEGLSGWMLGGGRAPDGSELRPEQILVAGHAGKAAMLASPPGRRRRLCLYSELRPAPPTAAVRLQGWTRAMDPTPTRGHASGQVRIDFLDGRRRVMSSVVAAEAVGVRDWRRFERMARVPTGAAYVRVSACTESGTTWVDDLSLLSTTPPVWLEERQGHFVFHHTAATPLDETARRRLEARLAWVATRLGVYLDGPPIDYWLHANYDSIFYVTGVTVGSFIDGDRTIHTVAPLDTHELVHAMSRRLASRPSAFLEEGLAVSLSAEWEPQGIHEVARGHASLRPIAPLADLDATFLRYNASNRPLAYAVAGSFVSYLIDTQGMDRFLTAYRSHGSLSRRIRLAYDQTLLELERAWIASVLEVAPSATTFDADPTPPEVHEGRIVLAIDLVSGGQDCASVAPPAEITAGHVLRLDGVGAAAWEITAGDVIHTGGGTFVPADGLPEGPAQLHLVARVGGDQIDCRLPLRVGFTPNFVVRTHQIEPDGRIWQSTTNVRAYHSLEPMTESALALPTYGRLISARDSSGAALIVEQIPSASRYRVSLPGPVEQGGVFFLTSESVLSPGHILVPEGTDTWSFDSGARPVAGVPTYAVDTFSLPHAAVLVALGDGVVRRSGDSPIELAHAAWVRPDGSFRSTFRYSLAPADGQQPGDPGPPVQ